MSRIPAAFRRLKKNNEAALVPYVVVGYPSMETTRTLLPVIARQGADMLELRLPSRDLLAAGSTTPRLSQANREISVTLADYLGVAAEARRSNEVPLLLRIDYPALRHYGLDRFAEDAAASGVDGIVVPGLAMGDAGEIKSACEARNIDLLLPLDPASTDEHLRRMVEMASGFLYCESFQGEADTSPAPSQDMLDLIARIRSHSDLPIILSGGIRNPEQAVEAVKVADGLIVGDGLVDLIADTPEDDLIIVVSDFIRSMKEATLTAKSDH